MYKGFQEYEKLASKVIEYYDFDRFEFIDAYADNNVVFATLKVGIKNSDKEIQLCEQFSFINEKISEIKVFVFK